MFIGQHVAGTIQPKRDWYICSEFTLVHVCICSEFTPSYAHITKEVAMIITRWINCGVCLCLTYGKISTDALFFNYVHTSINKSAKSPHYIKLRANH